MTHASAGKGFRGRDAKIIPSQNCKSFHFYDLFTRLETSHRNRKNAPRGAHVPFCDWFRESLSTLQFSLGASATSRPRHFSQAPPHSLQSLARSPSVEETAIPRSSSWTHVNLHMQSVTRSPKHKISTAPSSNHPPFVPPPGIATLLGDKTDLSALQSSIS